MTELAASGIRRQVLIVDGDSSFSQSLELDFKARSFDVETAGTADEAISRVAMARPDLVVLDLYLPNGAALRLLRLWKNQAPALVVILVSHNASLAIVVDALKEGAHRFFPKPVSAAALLDEFEERRHQIQSCLSPPLAADHRLGTATLKAEGVDRFFAVSPGLLSVAGFDGYFKMLNPAWEKTLGYSVGELCSKPYLDLIHPDDREKATDEAIHIRDGHTVFGFKNRYRCKDGSYRWLEWCATPSPAHQVIYASARDVTKSVHMEQGLREANERLKEMLVSGERTQRDGTVRNNALVELGRVKDELSAMIVHDLKNPLSVIVSNYDYILEGFEGSADCLSALQDSKSAGLRMLRLLANLVDVTRLEDGTGEVEAVETKLWPLLVSTAQERRVRAATRRIEIVAATPSDLSAVIDADMFIRAVENIFDNAMRYTPSGGRIEIEVREAGAAVEVRIGNSGTAIPIEARRTVFDKYSQLTPDVGRLNFGLGLHFCKLAIEAQGGQIWVEESAKLPTVFAMRLPRWATSTVVRSTKPLIGHDAGAPAHAVSADRID